MESSCIFCRIAAGELPCSKVYEDADTLAFLDIAPIVKGHTLVIPKAHHDLITCTPPEALQRLILVVRKIADAQIRGLAADGVNVTQANGRSAGQVVPHIHFHVIPRFSTDGHHWNWNSKSYDSPGEMRTFAIRIEAGLSQSAASAGEGDR